MNGRENGFGGKFNTFAFDGQPSQRGPGMTHASKILAQLRQAEEDESIPEEIREHCAERADEIEEELEELEDEPE